MLINNNNESIREKTAGIKVNGIMIINIRYADDIAIFLDYFDDLRRIVEKIKETSERCELKKSFSKTKFMI